MRRVSLILTNESKARYSPSNHQSDNVSALYTFTVTENIYEREFERILTNINLQSTSIILNVECHTPI